MNGCFTMGSNVSKVRVYAVASAEALPETAKTGTIAIISETTVAKVHVRVDEPSTPALGDVWIYPSLTAPRTYTIGLAVIPFAVVRQYDGSEWIKVSIYQYDGSEWISGLLYLLDGAMEGVEWCTYYTYAGKAEKVSDGYKITGSNGGNQPGMIQTAQKVDITGFSKLHCVGRNDTEMTQNFPFLIGIQSNQAYSDAGSYEGAYVIRDKSAASVSHAAEGDFDLTVDISKYSGEYYIGSTSGHESTWVYQIWLEV